MKTFKKLPLSYYQKPFWFEWKLNPNSSRYNTPLIYRIQGSLNKDALKEALFDYINHYHQSGRHYFVELPNGEVEQLVLETILLILEEEFIEGDMTEVKKKEDDFLDRYCNHFFDLRKPPLFKFGLLSVQEKNHILVLNFPHIITDAVTALFLVKNVSSLYNHYATGSKKPDLPLKTFEDLLVNEQASYPLEKRENDSEYWKQKLADKELRVDFGSLAAKAVKPQTDDSSYFSIDEKTTRSLKQLAKQQGTTPFVVLSALFSVLVYRYTEQKQFCLSYFINMRPPTFFEVPGCCINTIPLYLSLEEDHTFRDLFTQITAERKETRAHQQFAFLDLAEIIKNERMNDLKGSSDFLNVIISEGYLNLEPLSLNGCEVGNLFFKKRESLKDLFLIYQINDTIECRFDYRSSLFKEELIQQMIRHYLRLVEICLSNVDAKINHCSLFSLLEQQQILKDWNNTRKPYPNYKTIHQVFEEQVLKTPKRVALIFENQEMSYEVLNNKANQCGWALKEILEKKQKNKSQSTDTVKNTLTQTRIVILMDRQFELVIAILGILKAGACYIPLDPSDAEFRLQKVVENINPDIVLTLKHNSKLPFLKHCSKVMVLDSDWGLKKSFPTHNLGSVGSSSDLAYIIHTSGSTGTPKGVMIEHKSVVNIIQDVQKTLKVTENDRLLNLTSMAFDIYGLELYLALFSGACHMLCRSFLVKDPKKILDSFKKQQPSIVTASPTLWSLLLKVSQEKEWPFTVFSVAEGLSPALAKQLKNRSQAVWNLYGPTETTIISSYEKVEAETVCCIGKAFANTEIFVLDKNLNPVPPGIIGELYIGGAGLARGYFEDPELTSRAFIQNPFSEQEGSRLYKTGDRVRWLFNGKLEYCGRRDSQIKIRGFRVELGEIESVLSSHPQIRQCVVDCREENEEFVLVAYFVPKTLLFSKILKFLSCDVDEIREYLKTRLPQQMQPSAFIRLESIPLTITGKIDRAKLPKPSSSEWVRDPGSVRPYDTVEYKLKALWKNILKQDNFGIFDEFTFLGGHSIAAVHLITEINEQFKVQFPVAWILEHNTIRLQANQLRLYANASCAYNPVIRFQSAGPNAPRLVLINPALAGAEVYEDFSKALSKEISFYAIDSYNLNSGQAYCQTVEELAEKYIAYLQAVQPQGPYLIGGWSFGGLIAYEMAQQLEKKGEKVAKLYLLDGYIFKQDYVEDILTILNEDELIEAVPEHWHEYLISLPKPYLEKVFRSFYHDVRMMIQYTLKPYSGSAMLIKTTKLVQFNRLFKNYMNNGWKPFIQDLEVRLIDTDHFTLMEGEAVKQVAKIINKDIDLVSQILNLPA